MVSTVRIINDYIANEGLEITALDAPGSDGASHSYEIKGMDFSKNAQFKQSELAYYDSLTILFQNGSIPEVGVNGLTHEVLLAIVADRLRGFQTEPYACKENGWALTCVELALAALKDRTREFINRGVEGTRTV